MRLKILKSTAALVFAMAGTSAMAETCIDLGGAAVANFFGEGEGNPIIITATLSGAIDSAAGKITAQRTTATGLEMDLEHYFVRDDGGAFLTNDLAVLTAVPGKPGRFMIEITYEIQEDVTRGTLKGYKGSFNSYGLADLRDPDDMKGLVRYEGQICK